MKAFRVLPWIGGVLGEHAFPDKPGWRSNFVLSVSQLLNAYPGFAGIYINIEPWPSGNRDMLLLLDECRKALPVGKNLSVAAYPPPTRWHPFDDVHWDEPYFRAISQRVDQMAVMMYDTSLKYSKLYRNLMGAWTREAVTWAGATPVLLGLPCYEDAGVEYHHPQIENLQNALAGIHAGLSSTRPRGTNYSGVALYAEWTMEDWEWAYFTDHFLRMK